MRAGSEDWFGAEGGGPRRTGAVRTGAVRIGAVRTGGWRTGPGAGWCRPDRFGPERAGGPFLDGVTFEGEAPGRGRGTHPVKEAGHAREVEHPVKAAGRPVKVTGHAQEVEHPVKSVGVN